MAPDHEGPPRAPEHYRRYLLLLARTQVSPRLWAKLAPSDVAQDVLLKAYQALPRFEGTTEAQMLAWLRTILANVLKDKLPRIVRQVNRERSLEAALDESSNRLEAWVAAEQAAPGERLDRHGRLVSFSDALAQLPDNQRTAVELKYLHEFSVREISEHLGCTADAVGGLLKRGLRTLRKQLAQGH